MPKLVRRYVERQIKASMQSGDVESLRLWLSIAVGSPFAQQHVHYVFADNRTLLDYARSESNRLLSQYKTPSLVERVLPARTFTMTVSGHVETYYGLLAFIRNFFNRRKHAAYLFPAQALVSTVLQAMALPGKAVTLTRWQKFLRAFMPARNAIPDNSGRDDFEQFLAECKPSIAAANTLATPTSYPEKYTPTEVAERPALLKARMGIAPSDQRIDHRAFSAPEEKQEAPTYLAEWAKDVRIVQEHIIDQAQNQNFGQGGQGGQQLYQNVFRQTGLLQDSDYASADTHAGITSGLLSALRRKYKAPNIQLFSSHTVRDILNRTDDLFASFSKAKDKGYITLDNLPLGFSVHRINSESKEATLKFRLDYSDAKRAAQKKDPKHVLSIDTQRTNRTPAFTSDMSAMQQVDIDALFHQKGIVLTPAQRALSKQYLENFWRKPYLVDFLQNISWGKEQLAAQFFDRLMALEKMKPMQTAVYLGITSTNVLEVFLKFYSDSLAGFLSPSADAALALLPTLKEPCWQIFCLLSHVNFVSTARSFEENLAAATYFTDFFKGVFPTTLAHRLANQHDSKSKGMFFALSLVVECVTLSVLPKFQTSLLEQLPQALGLATEFLRDGSSFVHEGMLVEEEDFPVQRDILSLSYSEGEQGLLLTQSRIPVKKYFSALYLRYVASHVALTHTEAAYKRWTPEVVEHQWNELKIYLKTLPTRLESAESKKEQPETLCTPQAQYAAADITELLPGLGLTAEAQATLVSQLEQISTQTINYPAMREPALKQQLAAITQDIQSGENRVVQAIGIIRELHYRRTFNTSTSDPQVGEWLRLEQMVSILLGAYGYTSRLFQIETSEGKTLIISCIALLKALHGRKVNIGTHTEPMSKHAYHHLKRLVGFLGLEVADRSYTVDKIIDASIYCTDISNAISDKTLASVHFEADVLIPGMRVANDLIIDEVDNAVDMHAITNIEVSIRAEKSAQDAVIEQNVEILNRLIRLELRDDPHFRQLTTKDEKRAFIAAKLPQPLAAEFDLDYWIEAIVASLPLKESIDYVIEDQWVTIVPWAINGRKDTRLPRSQWSDGVHYCLTLWERFQGADVRLPGFSKLIASGDLASFVRSYSKIPGNTVIGFSGTLGTPSVRKKIGEVLGIEAEAIIMPRAKRAPRDNTQWPRVNGKTVYNCSYHFQPFFLEGREAHREKILEMLKASTDKCVLVHFQKIKECEKFAEFLAANGLYNVQLFDDKRDKENAYRKFRPQEATVLVDAKKPGMITLTTAVGGRGIDFDSLQRNIVTFPGADSIMKQAMDRAGRNGEFAEVYQVVCLQDLDATAQAEWAAAVEVGRQWQAQAIPNTLNVAQRAWGFVQEWVQGPQTTPIHVVPQTIVLQGMQARLDKQTADHIDEQMPLRELRQTMQQTMAEHLETCAPSTKKSKIQSWAAFFNEASKTRDVATVRAQWEAYKTISAVETLSPAPTASPCPS